MNGSKLLSQKRIWNNAIGREQKISPKCSCVKFFSDPLGSGTSAPSGQGRPRKKTLFFCAPSDAVKVFGPGRRPGYPPGCPRDILPKNLVFMGNVSETPTPTTCLKSAAVHLQFVRQYAPHLYRRAFLASKLRRKGNPAICLPLYCSTPPICTAVRPPICTAVLLENTGGWGHRNVSEFRLLFR